VSHSIETRGHRAFKASAMPLRVRSTSRFDLENNRLDVGGKLVGLRRPGRPSVRLSEMRRLS
jgi:hypothetical protein